MAINIHLHIKDVHVHTSDGGNHKEVMSLLNILKLQNNKIMADLTQLETEVQENATVIGSAITLLQGLKAQLDAAGTDPAKLAELSAQLDSQSNALATAVAANTPSEGGEGQ